MTVQHSFDIQRSEPVFHQRFCCLHIFFAHQDIKNDPAVVGADEGRIGHIKAAHLIDAITYFKQTGFGVELGIPPQTGVYSVRSIPVQIAVALQIPCKFAILGVDDLTFRIVQPAAFCVVKFPPVGKIQLFIPFGVLFCRDRRCIFDLARLGRVLENICDKVQTVFIGTACCVRGQGCAAGERRNR